MIGPIDGDLARQQLGDLISILDDLRDAGPRDQRFKQWRQITTTLLQRVWPDDPARAEGFRRVQFGAPTAFSGRRAARASFERGCGEARSLLEDLVLELSATEAAPGMPLEWTGSGDLLAAPAAEPGEEPVVVDDVSAAADVLSGAEPGTPAGEAYAETPEAPVPLANTSDASLAETSDSPTSGTSDAPLADTSDASLAEASDTLPRSPEPQAGSRLRLKDMLGFSDPPAPDATAERHAEGESPRLEPLRFVPLSPEPSRESRAPSSPATPSPALESPALESPVMESPAMELPALESLAAAPSATSELLALAARVRELGVPGRENPIVRAALVDLARQMESPPVSWETLREVLTLAMDHPGLARRVLPLLVPYLDRAA